MKKCILLFSIVFTITIGYSQKCGKPDQNFCPGNYFTNGNFEQVTGNPTARDSDDINLATGWSALWNRGGGTADLTCNASPHGLRNNPLPDSGFYGGMWIINSTNRTGENSTYREGMYNKLSSIVTKNSGTYSFNFDMANSGSTNSSNPVAIDIYGVYNPTNSTGSTPLSCYNPSNYNLWASNPSVKVFKLGTITTPVGMTNNWQAQTVTFNSNIITTPNITHIMITRSEDIVNKWGKMYINFDNFCLTRTNPETGVGDVLNEEIAVAVNLSDIPILVPQQTTTDCCPPWNEETIKQNMTIKQNPSGGLNANYTVLFTPTQTLKNQMQSYLDYAHAMNPSINAIIINWRLGKVNGTTCEGLGTMVGGEKFTTWNANNNGNINGTNFWSGYPMEVGIWYKLHTGIFLNDGQKFFDDNCANNDICIRIQIQNGMKVLEVNSNGKVFKTTEALKSNVKKSRNPMRFKNVRTIKRKNN